MPRFLKQYGARRTGTNHLRSLIRANYPDVIPLMHVLGDKHSPPVPFESLWRDAQSQPDPALAFAMTATQAAPGSSTRLGRPAQRSEVQRLAAPLAGAYANGTLGFVISIKDPYAWIPSVSRYFGWIGWHDRTTPLDASLVPRIEEACRDYNASYASWLELMQRHPDRCHAVRHEDLVADADAVLRALEARFGLSRAGAVTRIDSEASALDWDHVPEQRGFTAFDRGYYLDKRYLSRLSPEVHDAVTRTIDWSVAGAFGYSSSIVTSSAFNT